MAKTELKRSDPYVRLGYQCSCGASMHLEGNILTDEEVDLVRNGEKDHQRRGHKVYRTGEWP